MKQTALFSLALFINLGVSKVYGQTEPMPPASTIKLKHDFVQAGIQYNQYGTGIDKGYFTLRNNAASVSVTRPSATYIAGNFYASSAFPLIGFSNGRTQTNFGVSLAPAVGYVFSTRTPRFLPFMAGVASFGIQHYGYKQTSYNQKGTSWATEFGINLRLGAYYQIFNHWWLYGQLDSPTGHALLYHRTQSGNNPIWKLFNNTYNGSIPGVQIGAAYQVWPNK